MTKKIKDLPRYPDYVEGQTDHEFLQAAWALGPIALDKYGFITAFPQRLLLEFMDDRWTRQIELEGMYATGTTSGPMFDFASNVMLFSNGDVHRKRRGPLARTFAHKLIEDKRAEVATRCERMIGALRGRGSVDFLEEIAGPLPAQVIGAMLGVPEDDMPRFARHVYSAIRGLSLVSPEVRADSDADMALLTELVAGLIDARSETPDDGLVSQYLEKVAGNDLSQQEILAQMVGLVVAGSDTTRGALTATVSWLLCNPDQWALLVEDPDKWVRGAVNEGLRYDPVIGSMGRITLERREVEGVSVPEGTLISASMLTALRDPEVYADPDRFDITRQDHPRLHPVFGGGPHRCLGEALARIELEEALKALAHMTPDLKLDGEPARLRGYGAVRTVSGCRVLM
ncbi:MAG: cytochrome P450 [Paracoccaceae bacterium]